MSRNDRLIVALFVVLIACAGLARADWQTGLELFKAEEYAEASEHFREVMKSNPNWPPGYLMYGRTQLALGHTDEALEHLKIAVELGPENPANITEFARGLNKAKRYKEACNVLEGIEFESLDQNLKLAVTQILARALVETDQPQKAIAMLRERLAETPKSPVLHQLMAAACAAAGDSTGRLEHLAQAFELNAKDHPSARLAIKLATDLADTAGDDRTRANYLERALAIATTLAETAPTSRHLLLAGETALDAKEIEIANSWFLKAAQAEPENPLTQYYLGQTLGTLGHDEDAISHLRTALEHKPDANLKELTHRQLGRLLACRLELDEAAKHYSMAGETDRAKEIAKLASDFQTALASLAELRRTSSELAAASAQLDELGDSTGVEAVAERRDKVMTDIAEIESNLSDVRAALCQ